MKYLGNYDFLQVVEKHYGLTYDDLLTLSNVSCINDEEFLAMLCTTEEIKEEIYLTIDFQLRSLMRLVNLRPA